MLLWKTVLRPHPDLGLSRRPPLSPPAGVAPFPGSFACSLPFCSTAQPRVCAMDLRSLRAPAHLWPVPGPVTAAAPALCPLDAGVPGVASPVMLLRSAERFPGRGRTARLALASA
jgi:hypothetical protein